MKHNVPRKNFGSNSKVPGYEHIYDLFCLIQISGKYCKIQHWFHGWYWMYYSEAQLESHWYFQKGFQKDCLELIFALDHYC